MCLIKSNLLPIKDDKDRVVVALSKKIQAPFGGPFELKLKAYETRLQFARDVGICCVLVQSQ